MGRVCCWLRVGGGWCDMIRNNNLTIVKFAILRCISATLLCSVYILSFLDINALKTQKNGHLFGVAFFQGLCRWIRETKQKVRRQFFEPREKNYTFLVTAPPTRPHKNAIPFGMALSLWLTISIIFHRQLFALYTQFWRALRRYLPVG